MSQVVSKDLLRDRPGRDQRMGGHGLQGQGHGPLPSGFDGGSFHVLDPGHEVRLAPGEWREGKRGHPAGSNHHWRFHYGAALVSAVDDLLNVL